ncbi:hypothetical protein PENTCL1PPCAC_27655 [Pristionchus entomophagus]|uniref:G protein-coupled receptor n=1 Tax=Pristionchus entomophagus TaxID=358040 RepID=A0AAV5UG79_9BILA|nr:hypothetical protein PENTCL1PPCAC_27655 [Pristionchus entomophagus]
MFLLWFSVLLSACILTFLLRLKKFPLLFRVIYCVWNFRNFAVSIGRTTALVMIIFKEQTTGGEYVISQLDEAIDFISSFSIAALAVERLVANRLQKSYDSWKPGCEHVLMVLSQRCVPPTHTKI